MARNPNALKRANAFRRRVLEVIDLHSLSDLDAVSRVAEDFGIEFSTGRLIFRGYGRYRGDVCFGCHNPRRTIVRGGMCEACSKRARRSNAA